MDRVNKREELTAELDKLDAFDKKVAAKREQIRQEYVEFLIKESAGGLNALLRNQGKITDRDYEVLLGGLAKEIRKLYE